MRNFPRHRIIIQHTLNIPFVQRAPCSSIWKTSPFAWKSSANRVQLSFTYRTRQKCTDVSRWAFLQGFLLLARKPIKTDTPMDYAIGASAQWARNGLSGSQRRTNGRWKGVFSEQLNGACPVPFPSFHVRSARQIDSDVTPCCTRFSWVAFEGQSLQ